MPITSEQLEQMQAAFGEDGAEAFAAISAALDADAVALDAKTGEVNAASKATKKAQAELAKLQQQLEAGNGELDDKLKELLADKERISAELEAARGEHSAYRIRVKLAEALGITDPIARKAALGVFSLPEGAGINEAGELEGLGDSIKKFKESHGFFWNSEAEASGTAGGRKGGRPAARAGGKAPTTRQGKVLDWGRRLNLRTAQAAKGD